MGEKKVTIIVSKGSRKTKRYVQFGLLPRVFNALNPSERKLILACEKEPLEFVDNEEFHLPDAEKKIVQPVDWLIGHIKFRLHDLISADDKEVEVPRGVVLTKKQERLVFLQYNYCRFRYCFYVLSLDGKSITSVRTARTVLYWRVKALDLRDIIVSVNMPLVLFVAKNSRIFSVDFLELVCVGNTGLLRAVELFDVAKDNRFSTYACKTILSRFTNASQIQSAYYERFSVGFDPEMDVRDQRDIKSEGDDSGLLEDVIAILRIGSAHLSLRQEWVIRERFAIKNDNDAVPKTLKEVGQIIGITRERVRQIEEKALEKIRKVLEKNPKWQEKKVRHPHD